MRKATIGAMLTIGVLGGVVATTEIAVAAGDPAAGEKVFAKCKICHQIGPNAKNMVGPEQNGIDGRKAGIQPGYNYSDAIKNSGVTWNHDTFVKYVENPKAMIPGSKMIFAGLPKEQDREDLWAYMSQFKDDGSKK